MGSSALAPKANVPKRPKLSVALHKRHVLQLQHARLFNYPLAAAPSLPHRNNIHCHTAY